MEIKNLFVEKKWLLVTFLTFAFILVIVSTFSYRGLIFDQPAIFFSTISKSINSNHSNFSYLFYLEPKTRCLSSILSALPLNLLINFIPDNLIFKNNLFCFSYCIMTFLFLCFNIYLSTRTKRYDVAIWALVFYSMLYLPNSIWFARNIHICVLFQFALLQYFLSNEKLKIFDWICVVILALGVCETSENAILPLFLMFIYSLLCFIKNKEYSKRKITLGICALLSCVYIAVKTVFFLDSNALHLSMNDALGQYLGDLSASVSHLFDSCLIISVSGVILMIYLCLRNKFFSKTDIPFSLLLSGGTGYYLWAKTGFIPSVNAELCLYVLPIILMFFAVLFILFTDYIKFDINKTHFYSNLLFIACIIGIFNCAFQLNSCRYSYQYAMEFLDKINSPEKITIIENSENQSEAFKAFDTCFGTLHRTMILSPKKAQEKLVLPYKNPEDISFYSTCMTPTFYNKEENCLLIQSAFIFEHNKYFDIEKMKKLINDANLDYEY